MEEQQHQRQWQRKSVKMMEECENPANRALWNAVLEEKRSVVMLGKAGSGKSTAVRALLERLKEDANCQLLKFAPTECAARVIGGYVLGKFYIQDVAKCQPDTLWKDVMSPRELMLRRQLMEQAEVLVVDEVQGISAKEFDFLDRLCKLYKARPDLPFGGLQLILVGDPYQIDLNAVEKGVRYSIVTCGRIFR